MSWPEYIQAIKNRDLHGIERRLDVIDTARTLFASVNHYSDLKEDERKFIAGTPNKLYSKDVINPAFFGSMKGAGDFKQQISKNNHYISEALDQIPLVGPVARFQYDRFIELFSKTLEGKYMATTTRLLAMKRPDIFYCLTSQNKKRFCEAFGLVRSHIDYKMYWEGVVLRLQDCEWYTNPTPRNEQERRIMGARAAFIDAIYYEQKQPKSRKTK